ncbi:MAG: aspartate aminotransferase family protein [Verrucomicrobia bacterium]|nr:aspartate aminotransferase family protein [Verrucomicrobiota bacterium]
MSRYAHSKKLFERASRAVAGGVNSQWRAQQPPHPLFFTRGAGSRLWDADDNEYVDWALGEGTMVLGHSPAGVIERIIEAICGGQLYGGQHEAEVLLAEKLCKLIPCAEVTRLALSGSEAVHLALRLARAAKRRPRFIRFEGHYHGWMDGEAVSVNPTPDQHGPRENPMPVPWSDGQRASALAECVVLPWNDLDLARRTVERLQDDIAAVITEPVMGHNGCVMPEQGFLEGLRRTCDTHNVLLIFDECLTGFRLSAGGAQQHFGVTPDLAVFGGAMGNGFPISALAGRRKLMDLVATGACAHAGTANAGCASVTSALATIEKLEADHGAVFKQLADRAKHLMEGLRRAAQAARVPVLLQGPGPMFHLGFTSQLRVRDYRDTTRYDRARYVRFCRAMLDHGVRLLPRGVWFVSAAHTEEDIQKTVAAAEVSLKTL